MSGDGAMEGLLEQAQTGFGEAWRVSDGVLERRWGVGEDAWGVSAEGAMEAGLCEI